MRAELDRRGIEYKEDYTFAETSEAENWYRQNVDNSGNADIRYEKKGKRERTAAEKEINNRTDEEVGVMRHEAFAMQSEYKAQNGTMPLEMGLLTANHFVIVNNVELGNISAVRAFDIEKQQKETTDAVKEIYRRYTDAGLSEDSRRVIEEFGRIYGNGARNNLSRELGQMADRGVHAVGERQQSDRGADNALDGGTHLATEWCFIKYRYSRCTDTIKCDQAE